MRANIIQRQISKICGCLLKGKPSERQAKRQKKDQTQEDAMTAAISAAVTAKVLENLKENGILPQPSQKRPHPVEMDVIEQEETTGEPTHTHHTQTASFSSENVSNFGTRNNQNIVQIPAQSLVAGFDQVHHATTTYKPIGRPLYTKINSKLQEKIKNKEFIDMSDILVDHHPAELDFHLAVQNNRVGLTSGKKKRYVNIESWTDAFSIFSSVIRKFNPNHPTFAEDLAIYMDLIRQIQKDGGDWYFYDVNFRQLMQNDDTLSWSYVDQILHTRSLNRFISKANNTNTMKRTQTSNNAKPFPNSAPRRTCNRFNEGRICDGTCGYSHICSICFKGHSKSQLLQE
ncbi:Hypothetical predicted protein [Mytilus galloprovincialis]|uniref:C3H1-type domain-containing protein n=1 Tax=Mytilus galloprovincialis TaxID=29158 RepID=A0A8B6CN04_MYTGA|nr:Hypothetical predicted protein [Mytilus galloprovincialis]